MRAAGFTSNMHAGSPHRTYPSREFEHLRKKCSKHPCAALAGPATGDNVMLSHPRHVVTATRYTPSLLPLRATRGRCERAWPGRPAEVTVCFPTPLPVRRWRRRPQRHGYPEAGDQPQAAAAGGQGAGGGEAGCGDTSSRPCSVLRVISGSEVRLKVDSRKGFLTRGCRALTRALQGTGSKVLECRKRLENALRREL